MNYAGYRDAAREDGMRDNNLALEHSIKKQSVKLMRKEAREVRDDGRGEDGKRSLFVLAQSTEISFMRHRAH